jgi:hypothetical protein
MTMTTLLVVVVVVVVVVLVVRVFVFVSLVRPFDVAGGGVTHLGRVVARPVRVVHFDPMAKAAKSIRSLAHSHRRARLGLWWVVAYLALMYATFRWGGGHGPPQMYPGSD